MKTCFYASLFGGGTQAMMKGVFKEVAKNRGITYEKIKYESDYETLYKIATELASIIYNLPILEEYRSLSTHIKKEYYGKKLMKPTGHRYLIQGENGVIYL